MATEEKQSLLDDHAETTEPQLPSSSQKWSGGMNGYPCPSTISIIVFGSLLLNLVLAALLIRGIIELYESRSSLYVGLKFDHVSTITHHSSYGQSNSNETERAILWENLDGSSAQVAIDKSWATWKQLPPSQDFSWDNSKSVYSLRGFHGQHCLRKIYRWVAISHHNGTQLDHYDHVIHCIDSLLQDVHCLADDTPMIDTPGSWGEGQQRQCRDWNKLKQWAQLHNACFSYINETQGVQSMFDRYKWCPPESQYEEKMRLSLGLPKNRSYYIPKDIDSLPTYWAQF